MENIHLYYEYYLSRWIMLKISETKMKEVINIANGERMGYIYDFEIDLDRGAVTGIIMSGNPKGLGLFFRPNDIIISWDEVIKIGQDIILVSFNG